MSKVSSPILWSKLLQNLVNTSWTYMCTSKGTITLHSDIFKLLNNNIPSAGWGNWRGPLGRDKIIQKLAYKNIFLIIILFEVYMQIFNGYMWCTFHLMRVHIENPSINYYCNWYEGSISPRENAAAFVPPT